MNQDGSSVTACCARMEMRKLTVAKGVYVSTNTLFGCNSLIKYLRVILGCLSGLA